MHMDPAIPYLLAVALVVLLLGLGLKMLKQPSVVAYILAGVALGPDALGVVGSRTSLDQVGSFGVLFLLFFVGMEINPRQLVSNWKIPVVGTALQILLSTLGVVAVGALMAWPLNRSILLGFVMSLGSTAVVLTYLQQRGQSRGAVGEGVTGILLVQDLAIVPMMIAIAFMGGEAPSPSEIALQVVGGIAMVALVAWIISRDEIKVPYLERLLADHELQVFAALTVCLGLALLTGLFGLSSALGAFIAGMLVSAAQQTDWVHRALDPFRVVGVGAFFLSIGLLIDVTFLFGNLWILLGLVALAFGSNTAINGVILKALGLNRGEALYGGALLAPIGEFSFVLMALGFNNGAISELGYQMGLCTIALTLLLSPMWFGAMSALGGRSPEGQVTVEEPSPAHPGH